jgi:hypothetical protein
MDTVAWSGASRRRELKERHRSGAQRGEETCVDGSGALVPVIMFKSGKTILAGSSVATG